MNSNNNKNYENEYQNDHGIIIYMFMLQSNNQLKNLILQK